MASFILQKAHYIISQVVEPGDIVVDGTVGNGRDTVFLARLVGPDGLVVGFDVQAVALANARSLLSSEGLLDRCRLYQRSHEDVVQVLNRLKTSSPKAAMFNLGYLPGGVHSVTTEPETTVRSLTALSEALSPGGIITVVAYQGHRGARQEVGAVTAWIDTMLPDKVVADKIQDPAGPPHAPILFVIRKG